MNERVIQDIRQRLGLSPEDPSKDHEIRQMSQEEFLNAWLEWNGIIGFTHSILKVLEEHEAITLERLDEKTHEDEEK